MNGAIRKVPKDNLCLCTICQGAIQAQELSVQCESCGCFFHAECWRANEGCGTYGCERAPRSRTLVVTENRYADAWGDTKPCPQCGELLDSPALKCKRCRAQFDTRVPMTPAEYLIQEKRKRAMRVMTAAAISLFSVGLFGILAPLVLPLSGICLGWRWRLQRRATGPVEILLLGSFVLSAAYTVLIVAIFVGGW
jgi:hypothetical protein